MASGLRGGIRHLRGLFSDPCRTEEVAPHLGKHVQLRAAHHSHTHQHLYRIGPPHMEETGRHGLGLYRCVDCQPEPRSSAIKKKGCTRASLLFLNNPVLFFHKPSGFRGIVIRHTDEIDAALQVGGVDFHLVGATFLAVDQGTHEVVDLDGA